MGTEFQFCEMRSSGDWLHSVKVLTKLTKLYT